MKFAQVAICCLFKLNFLLLSEPHGVPIVVEQTHLSQSLHSSNHRKGRGAALADSGGIITGEGRHTQAGVHAVLAWSLCEEQQ